MKKNRMMRLASILLVCVLLTTSVISGTFAKYTSTATASDTARVAKWGWGTTEVTLDLFDSVYQGTDGETVMSKYNDNVIAPGTSKAAAITWVADQSFTPEVDYNVTFAVNAIKLPANLEQQLKWTLQVNGGSVSTYDTFAALKAEVATLSYKGEAAQAVPTIDVKIGWVWEFEEDDDHIDTALGNMDNLNSLEIQVVLTATQIN